MRTFDGWETRLYGDAMALPNGDELMHFRTKGSKNGVRRYQTESGEWTPLGLKERKAREGWGQSRKERKAEKAVARSARKAAKLEKKAAKANARKEWVSSMKEKRRKSDLSKLTDEELRQKLARIKMEQEYKELTRSPLLKSGEKIVTSVLEARARRFDREEARAKRILEDNRIKSEIIKARESTKQKRAEAEQAKSEAKKARSETETKKWDVKGGLATQRKKELVGAKLAYRNTTIRGGIGKYFNSLLGAKGQAKGETKKEKAFVDSLLDTRSKIDKYNRKNRKRGSSRLSYDPNEWDRKKNGVATGSGKKK